MEAAWRAVVKAAHIGEEGRCGSLHGKLFAHEPQALRVGHVPDHVVGQDVLREHLGLDLLDNLHLKVDEPVVGARDGRVMQLALAVAELEDGVLVRHAVCKRIVVVDLLH